MMRRMIAVALGVGVVAMVTAVYAQNAGQPSSQQVPDTSKIKDKVTLEEKKLAEKFNAFVQQLSQLKERLAKGSPEDQAYAKVLEKVIEHTKNKSIDVRFQEMVDSLKKAEKLNINSATEMLGKSQDLVTDLQGLLALIRQDKSLDQLRDEQKKLEQILKNLNVIIANQKFIQGQTQNQIFDKTTDPKGVLGKQENVSKDTSKIAKQLDKDGQGDNKGGGNEGEIAKSDAKSNDKGEGNKSDSKGDAKPGDAKGDQGAKGGKEGDGQKDNQGAAKGDKSGEPGKGKDGGKEGDGQKGNQGAAKSGDGQKGDPKAGGSKSGDGQKPGSQSGAKGDGQKGGDPKAGGQPSDSKGGGQPSSKGGDPKAGGSKSSGGDPKGGQGGAKGDGQKGGQPMNPNDKGNQSGAKNSSKGDQGQAKGGDPKGGQGGSKSAGSPKGGDPKGGGSSSKGGGSGEPKDGGSSGGSKGGKGGDQDPQSQAKKQIEDANHYQKMAEKDIKSNKPEEAVDKQTDAVKELEKAKKKLEDILKQLREEEVERLLAALQLRCEHMLIMQIAVRDSTVSIGESIQKNNNKVSALHKSNSLNQADKEKEIIQEATKAIELLEAEGSSVAFPEVFKQVREDMKNVAGRLENTDVGVITVAIENDIIQSLEDMVAALKKARDDNKKKKGGKGGDGKGGGGKQDQKLLEKLAELKLLRSEQAKINGRTNLYAKQYQGEQANDPQIQKALQDLSDRQERLFEATKKIAKGDNQ